MKIQLGVIDILLIILITLKVIGISQLSWWWTFSPLWLPIIAVDVFICVYVLISSILSLFSDNSNEKEE